MKRAYLHLTILTVSILLFSSPVFILAQDTYSRVKVNMEGRDINDLAELGLEVDHGQYAPHRFFINDFSSREIELIEAAGFEVEIQIADIASWYVSPERQNLTFRSPNACFDGVGGNVNEYPVPENFSLGSVAGFFSYQEMLDNLDAMAAQYPDLISPREGIDDILSVEGHPIYWLRISDNPNVDEEEPEVLYNALHHAREPNSLSQIIYFMWYLLENYETDPNIQYLVNNTELYFIPCVNPDGYIYNEQTNPDGGGLWRKNRRDNGDGTFGVDLNRNYGFEWAYDDWGSSPNTESDVYRGPGPFSEPETQAVRDFCNDHEFKIALNYHTFGNLLIYPWGYSDTPTDDALTFNSFADLMTLENNYLAGTGTETVGYTVNGDSDDWMYGETTTKPPIFSMTPEVGRGGSSGGFWPIMDDIIPNCQATMWMNLTAANLVHNYGFAKDIGEDVLVNQSGQFEFDLTRYGLLDGPLTVSISAISDNIASLGVPLEYNLAPFESVTGAIDYTLTPDIASGEEVEFKLSVFNGIFTIDKTISKTYSEMEPAIADPADDLDNWVTEDGFWGLTTEDFYSETTSITDSPNSQYPASTINRITLNRFIDFSEAISVKLNFWAKWEIEADYDYVQVQIAVDEDFYFPVCGLYSREGTQFQDFNEPVYDGIQADWVQEDIDLSEYLILGDSISLRFILVSDNFVQGDGFYVDDINLTIFEEELVSSTTELTPDQFRLSQNEPNPARSYTQIDVNTDEIDYNQAELIIYNSLGQVQERQRLPQLFTQRITLNTTDWAPGIYYYQLLIDSRRTQTKRMSIVK